MEKRYVVAICESTWKGENLDIFIKPESELKGFVFNAMDCHCVVGDEEFDNEDDLEKYWNKICDEVIEDKVKKQEVFCEEAIIAIRKID